MNRTNSILFPNSGQELREAHIRSFAQKTGEQAGQIVSDFLSGILTLLLTDRPPDSVKSVMPTQAPRTERPQPTKQESETLLTGPEVAEQLNINKGKAYRLMSEGRIPSVRFDKTVRVRKQDLEKFVNSHIVTSE